MDDPRLVAYARLLGVVDRLREPDGCPWDLEQSVESLGPSLVEEAHEIVEAVETGDVRGQVEEVGDLHATLALVCRIAQQTERFDLTQACEAAADKLVRRHPHVFGDASAEHSGAVLSQWEEIKRKERAEGERDASAVAGVPVALPALQRAQRLGGKAMSTGFRWADASGALAKLGEELDELREAFARAADDPVRRTALEHELGDLCLAAGQLANYLDLDAEVCTRAATRRFEARFRAMEAQLGGRLAGRTLEEWMAAWRAAKEQEPT